MHAQLRWPQAASGPGQLRSRAGAGGEGEGRRRWRVPGWQVRQPQVRLDLVAVAAAVFPLHHVAGRGQVGDDAVGAALGDAHAGRDVAQPHAPVVGDAQRHPGVAGQEDSSSPPLRTDLNF